MRDSYVSSAPVRESKILMVVSSLHDISLSLPGIGQYSHFLTYTCKHKMNSINAIKNLSNLPPSCDPLMS